MNSSLERNLQEVQRSHAMGKLMRVQLIDYSNISHIQETHNLRITNITKYSEKWLIDGQIYFGNHLNGPKKLEIEHPNDYRFEYMRLADPVSKHTPSKKEILQEQLSQIPSNELDDIIIIAEQHKAYNSHFPRKIISEPIKIKPVSIQDIYVVGMPVSWRLERVGTKEYTYSFDSDAAIDEPFEIVDCTYIGYKLKQ